MARQKEQWWVSKADQTLDGQKVTKGQLIRPTGAVKDKAIYQDNSRWAYRYDGGDSVLCDTDGCGAQFINLGLLERHREIIHKPERDTRERERLARMRAVKEAEEAGETIGGHEVVGEKRGPRGPVPYIAPMG